MKRMILVLAFAATVSMAGAAMGQGPGGPGGFKKKGAAPAAEDDGVTRLESELAKLRSQLQDLEELVNRAKAAAAPGAKGKGKEGKGPGGSPEKKEAKETGSGGPPEKKETKGFGPGGPFRGGNFEKKEGKSFGEGTFEKKGRKDFGPPAGPAAPASIEERLDRILRELEDIRREMKNQ